MMKRQLGFHRSVIGLIMLMWLISGETWSQSQLQIKRSNELTRSAIQLLHEQNGAKAKAQLQRAIRLNPKNILANELLAILLYREQRFREAEKHANLALAINSRSSRALFVIGAINAQRGKGVLAAQQLRTAMVSLPEAEYRTEAKKLLDKISQRSDEDRAQQAMPTESDAATLPSDYHPAVAVFPFEDGNARAELTKLGQSITEMLITALIQRDKFTVIERAQLDKIISEQALSQTGLLDTETALEIGKLSGLEAIIVGSVTQLKSALEADARLIDVASGKALAAASSRVVNVDNIRQLADELANQLAAKAHLIASPADTSRGKN